MICRSSLAYLSQTFGCLFPCLLMGFVFCRKEVPVFTSSCLRHQAFFERELL